MDFGRLSNHSHSSVVDLRSHEVSLRSGIRISPDESRSTESNEFNVLNFLQLLTARVLKPFTRFFLGFIAIPIFRFVMRKVARVHEVNEELEKDLEQWFRGSLLLLVATENMEQSLFSWLPAATREGLFFEASRILLAIGVIEGMPDQALFAIIHPGPSKPKLEKGQILRGLIAYLPQFSKGILCQHLNRSSPVFAILSVLHPGPFGWACYGLAIAQYLIIGLVTSRDKAVDVLSQFDAAVARQRDEIVEELQEQQSQQKSDQSMVSRIDSY